MFWRLYLITMIIFYIYDMHYIMGKYNICDDYCFTSKMIHHLGSIYTSCIVMQLDYFPWHIIGILTTHTWLCVFPELLGSLIYAFGLTSYLFVSFTKPWWNTKEIRRTLLGAIPVGPSIIL
jgi:hypothetical protein